MNSSTGGQVDEFVQQYFVAAIEYGLRKGSKSNQLTFCVGDSLQNGNHLTSIKCHSVLL